MPSTIARVHFVSAKNCFVAVWLGGYNTELDDRVKYSSTPDQMVQVFRLTSVKSGVCVYVSRLKEMNLETSAAPRVMISDVYAQKLGIKAGEEVQLSTVSACSPCTRVNIEPLSVDDWEIMELNASVIEAVLLNQIRVIWTGQVFPIWLHKATHIFVKIGEVIPAEDCVILVQNTELVISSKDRKRSLEPTSSRSGSIPLLGTPVDDPQITDSIPKQLLEQFQKGGQSLNSSSKSDPSDTQRPDSLGVDIDRRKTKSLETNLPKDFVNQQRRLSEKGIELRQSWSSMIKSMFLNVRSIEPPSSNVEAGTQILPIETIDDSEGVEDLNIDISLSLRVESLFQKFHIEDFTSSCASTPSTDTSEERPDAQFRLLLLHTSTVYIHANDVSENCNISLASIPPVFYAKLRKLVSPLEKGGSVQTQATGKLTDDKAGNPDAANESDEDEKFGMMSNVMETSKPKSPGEQQKHVSSGSLKMDKKPLSAYVKVVVVQKHGIVNDAYYQNIVQVIQGTQQITKGRILVPDLLRRQLKLDVTGRACLDAVLDKPRVISSLTIYPLTTIPLHITTDMVEKAVRNWLEKTTDAHCKMLIFQQMLIRFMLWEDLHVEALVTFNDMDGKFALLHPARLHTVAMTIKERSHGKRRWDEITHLPGKDVEEIDPPFPQQQLEQLGAVTDLAKKCLNHIHYCLRQSPLIQTVSPPSSGGIQEGVLLIAGPRGVGKSALANAVCRQSALPPLLAYTCVVECKTLRGKRIESIQHILEKFVDAVSWRQPSVILLDDIDHIASAASGPDADMSGEAQYAASVAHVIRQILEYEIRSRSNIAFIFTARSLSSIHPLLIATRGQHVIQAVVEIAPPDKKARAEILERILSNKRLPPPYLCSAAHISMDNIVAKTEGSVAQDLRTVIDRAIHAHIMHHKQEAEIDNEDFDESLEGFVPASLRNVSLYHETESSWDDVGGLANVRMKLLEILEYPHQYPELFASLPLRLPSGILLFGAPGTGKTLLARVIAKECGLKFISVKGPELLSKYIGASEQAVRDLFLRAQSARPCILFFDEFDAIAPRRGHDSTGVTDRVVNQFLTQLDGVEGLEGVNVLAATSRPDLIDPALFRPGRLDKCLYCDIPTEEEQVEIIQSLSRKMTLDDGADLPAICKQCEYFTGADLKALLYNAQLEAIHSMPPRHKIKGTNSGVNLKDMAAGMSSSGLDGDRNNVYRQVLIEKPKPLSLVYIPRIGDGVTELSAEKKNDILFQILQLEKSYKKSTLRKSSVSVSENMNLAEGTNSHMIMVNQSHLEKAASGMRPSVSTSERLRYQSIYERFMKSRGGNFGGGSTVSPADKRATLA